MNEQEMLNQVYQYFIVERHRPGLDPFHRLCKLHQPNGDRCALGIFIPDEHYSREMETMGLEKLVMTGAGKLAFGNARLSFLHDLRRAHDSCASEDLDLFRHDLAAYLAKIAKTNELTYPGEQP